MGQFIALADLAKYYVGGHPAKLTKASDNLWLGQGTKLTGDIMYFLPKDKEGTIVGTPKRLLRVGNAYYDADLIKTDIQPIVNYIGGDNVYGADGNTGELSNTTSFDLSNADGLDESISNAIGDGYSSITNESLLDADGYSEVTNESLLNATGVGAVKAIRKTQRFADKGRGLYYLVGHYEKGVTKTVKEIKNTTFFNPKTKQTQKIKLLVFDDGSAGAVNGWENTSSADGDYSAITNESLLDMDGYSNVTNESLLNADGDTPSAYKPPTKIADPNTAVVDEKTMLGMFKKSGTKKSFKEWVKSDSVKSALNTLVQLGGGLLNKKAGGSDIGLGTGGSATNPNDEFGAKGGAPHEAVTILGMTPITFGIVSLAVIGLGAIVTIKLLKHK